MVASNIPAVTKLLLLLPSLVSGALLGADEKAKMLALHNQKRCMAGVPPLTWDDDLAQAASSYADTSPGAVHSTALGAFKKYGECLQGACPSDDPEKAMKFWYDSELPQYTGQFTATHYTQVVWKGTTKVGCGSGPSTGLCTGGKLYVCQYTPLGNQYGQYDANVFAPSKDASQCPLASGHSDESSPSPPPPAMGASTYTGLGCTCKDTCGKGSASYTWCHDTCPAGVTHSDNWDYCDASAAYVATGNGQSTASGCKCKGTCAYYGKGYTWCESDCRGYTWDYCDMVPQNPGLAATVADYEADSNTVDAVEATDYADVDVPDCGACGTTYQLTKDEARKSLNIHNKMRKAVGSPPLKWNCQLQCQVQKWADRCTFAHSSNPSAFNSPIKAGENLASGHDGEMAAWMWFSEYGQASTTSHATFSCCGHFTAMVWKSTKEIGCGACKKNGDGSGDVFLCQYTNSQPNFGYEQDYAANVPVFAGTAAQYRAGGLDPEEAKKMFHKFQSWGLDIGSALSRFYDLNSQPTEQKIAQDMMLPGVAVLATVLLMVSILIVRRRNRTFHPVADSEETLQ